ncbi:hypothetical protein PAEPH01_1120 [Pancytospora epiphaga]|nr:hypothetical protein PAEPH01_1120 [Pancytospora epiphaga]
MSSDNTDFEARNRGRSKKLPQPFRFGPYVYNSPLGCQYTMPIFYTPIYSAQAFTRVSPVQNQSTSQQPVRRERRMAAIKVLPVKKKKRHSSEESENLSDEQESVEEDPYERLLDYNEEEDKFLVKFRNKSYLHCDWVSKEEICVSRVGTMKVKRYKFVGLDEEACKVDRILNETFEDGQKIVLIKWRGQPYENSTFELYNVAEKCEGFEAQIQAYRDRRRMRHMRVPMDWRPARDNHIKYTESPTYKKNNTLRHYQLEGLNWLLNRWYFKQSCIMADEMGLGKTVQSVVFANALFTAFEYNVPILIVAPLSTIVHWEREFSNWTDLRVLTYHGSIQGRSVINMYEFNVKTGNITVRLFDVLITTYEMAMTGAEHLSQFEFGVGIFDEAHRLKNANSKAAICLRNFSIQHKVLLSGTPIQNNLNELWALFNFIDPSRFNNMNSFLEEYKMERTEDVEKLQMLLKPLMLRRMKEDVETSIPMKEETIIEVELTTIQKRYYRAILEKNIEFLTKGDKTNVPNLINAMMELRKCCIHPYLLNGAEEKIVGDYVKRTNGETVFKNDVGTGAIKFGDYYFNGPDEYYKILIQSSGKLVLLDKLLKKLHGQHKVLIFSQMTRCLNLLSEYLNYRNYKHERIDGGVRGDLRQAAIDRFSAGDAFVFLLCTRAGGVGINLTAADTVIIFDSDWNPQNDLQAQARCHRIGQKNEVKIYRLITKNSYEREMFDKAGMKLGLDRAVLQRMSFDQKEGSSASGRKEDAIQLLLRKGAYGILMEADDASQKFCEEDIDQILERRTRIIKHSDGGNVFSKATFQVEEDIEDPDFWENLLSQKKSEETEGRIKRQCRRLAREGVLTVDDQKSICEIHESLGRGSSMHANKLDGEIEENNQREIELFKLFVGILYASPMEMDVDIFTPKVDIRLGQLVKYCLDLVSPLKLKGDFSVYLDVLVEDYDPNQFLRFADIYLKYHEQFLFRIQIPLIIQDLSRMDDIYVEKARGWSSDDDRTIIQLLLSKGYDNFVLKDKPKEEVNQRVRRIISVLYHRKEVKENDNMYFQALLNFGRPTERNEYAIEKFLKRDLSKMHEIVNRICSMSRRSRRDTADADAYERIMFFDRLESLESIPILRKAAGMPRKWDSKKDSELRDYLLTEGFILVNEKMGVTCDAAMKRFEALFKVANVPMKE